MMTTLTQEMFKVEILANLTILDADDPGNLDEFLVEFFEWVEASAWLDDSLSISRDAFRQFITSLLSVDELEIGTGEVGSILVNGTWHVALSISFEQELSDSWIISVG